MKLLLSVSLFVFMTLTTLGQGIGFGWAEHIANNDTIYGVLRIQDFIQDDNGDLYLVGPYSDTVDFDPGPGIHYEYGGGIYVLKLDSNGGFIWVKTIQNADNAFHVVADNHNNVYVTGLFKKTVDFDPDTGIFNMSSTGFTSQFDDIYILKLSSSGSFKWAKQLRSYTPDYINDLITDGTNSIYLTGNFADQIDVDPDTSNHILKAKLAGTPCFILKLDLNGRFVWAQAIDGRGWVKSNELDRDINGNILVTGSFTDTIDLNPGSALKDTVSAGEEDIFVAKLDSMGNHLWSHSVGHRKSDVATSITSDISGSIYVAGYFERTVDFDPGLADNDLISEGGKDLFVMKLDAGGNFVWVYQLGSSFDEYDVSVLSTNDNNILLSGYFYGEIDFDPGSDSVIVKRSNTHKTFINKIDTAKNFKWLRYFNYSTGSGVNNIVKTDQTENIYIATHVYSTSDLDPTSDTFTLQSKYGQFAMAKWSNINCSNLQIDTSLQITDTSVIVNAAQSTYQWLNCQMNYAKIPGETNALFVPDSNGSYAAKVNTNECIDTSQCVVFSTLSIDDLKTYSATYVYPNPSTGNINIEVGNNEPYSIRIYSLSGSLVMEKHTLSGKAVITIEQEPGVYLLELISDKGTYRTKLIVQ